MGFVINVVDPPLFKLRCSVDNHRPRDLSWLQGLVLGRPVYDTPEEVEQAVRNGIRGAYRPSKETT